MSDLFPTELELRLNEFKTAMLTKFWLRAPKHEKSVTDPEFNWATDMDREELQAHLEEELTEWLESKSDDERRAEAVDVANMMFMLWTTSKEEKR